MNNESRKSLPQREMITCSNHVTVPFLQAFVEGEELGGKDEGEQPCDSSVNCIDFNLKEMRVLLKRAFFP